MNHFFSHSGNNNTNSEVTPTIKPFEALFFHHRSTRGPGIHHHQILFGAFLDFDLDLFGIFSFLMNPKFYCSFSFLSRRPLLPVVITSSYFSPIFSSIQQVISLFLFLFLFLFLSIFFFLLSSSSSRGFFLTEKKSKKKKQKNNNLRRREVAEGRKK